MKLKRTIDLRNEDNMNERIYSGTDKTGQARQDKTR